MLSKEKIKLLSGKSSLRRWRTGRKVVRKSISKKGRRGEKTHGIDPSSRAMVLRPCALVLGLDVKEPAASVTATSFPAPPPAGNARLSGTPLPSTSFARSLPWPVELRRLVRSRCVCRGRFPFALADKGGSRCAGEEAFSTCLRGEGVMPFFGREGRVGGGEGGEMGVGGVEGGGSSASSESDAEVSDDEDSGSG